MNKEIRDKFIFAMRNRGYSLREIAECFNVSHEQVRHWLKDLTLKYDGVTMTLDGLIPKKSSLPLNGNKNN